MVDTSGRRYLDFYSGIAVNALGHSHAGWLETVTQQAGKLTHTSNMFHTQPQVELAKRLVRGSFADRVFYANSGTEANEAAIKFARKYAKVKGGFDPIAGGRPAESACACAGRVVAHWFVWFVVGPRLDARTCSSPSRVQLAWTRTTSRRR